MCDIRPYRAAVGNWHQKQDVNKNPVPIQGLTHVFNCDSEALNLSRYRFNKHYVFPTIDECRTLLEERLSKKAEFNRVAVYFLACSDKELEEYKKYVPDKEKITRYRLDPAADKAGWDKETHPVVLVLPKHQVRTILKQQWLTENVIVLFSGSNQACHPASESDDRMFQKLITAETTQTSFIQDLDRALNRYLFSFLKQFAEKLGGKGETNPSQNSETFSKLQDLRTEIQVLFEQSDVPRSEFPSEIFEIRDQPLSDKQKRRLFAKLKEIPTVVGFGFRHHVLQINIDKTAPHREKITKEVKALMKEFQISPYEFTFVAKELVSLRRCGESIVCPNNSATLGCFAYSKSQLYALTSEHITYQAAENKVYMNEDRTQLGHIHAVSAEMDIAAIGIRPDLAENCDLALRDEDGRPLTMACPVWVEETFRLPLPVYIFGAKTRPGIGKIVSTDHYVNGFTPEFLLIENKNRNDFCQPGDSGSIVIARPKHDTLFALGMIKGSIRPEGPGPNQYVAIRLQHSLPEIENKLKTTLTLHTNQLN